MKKIILITLFLLSQAIVTLAQNSEVKKIWSNKNLTGFENLSSLEEKNFKEINSLLWIYEDDNSITRVVSITSGGNYIWVGQMTNDEKLQLFALSSPVPLWEFLLDTLDGPNILVDCASSASDTILIAAISDDTQNIFYIFYPDSPLPFWLYEFQDSTSSTQLVVSQDISTAAVAVYCPADTLYTIYCFDLTANDTLWTYIIDRNESGYAMEINITTDGTRVVFSCYNKTYLIDSGELLWERDENSLCGSDVSISGDGSIIAVGDLHGELEVFHWNETDSTYSASWSYYIPPTAGFYNWISSVDVSEDGSTIMLGSLEWVTEGKAGRVAMFNADSSATLWEYLDCGDKVASVKLSYDGSIGIVGSYGDTDNLLPDLLIFSKASLTPIGSCNSTGSFFSVDISSDGKYAVGGAKMVHATTMGHGGYVYAIETNITGIDDNHNFIKSELSINIYPNPFNTSCQITITKEATGKIYDMQGNLVKTFYKTPYFWQPSDKTNSGIYFIKAITKGQVITKKIAYLK